MARGGGMGGEVKIAEANFGGDVAYEEDMAYE